MGDSNRARANACARSWRARNPDKVRASLLRNRYGITPEEYGRLLGEQGGVCAICREPESAQRAGRTIELSVDHDRTCCPGKRSCGRCIRGLLCGNCNPGLGQFKDDPARLRAAIEYLRKEG